MVKWKPLKHKNSINLLLQRKLTANNTNLGWNDFFQLCVKLILCLIGDIIGAFSSDSLYYFTTGLIVFKQSPWSQWGIWWVSCKAGPCSKPTLWKTPKVLKSCCPTLRGGHLHTQILIFNWPVPVIVIWLTLFGVTDLLTGSFKRWESRLLTLKWNLNWIITASWPANHINQHFNIQWISLWDT